LLSHINICHDKHINNDKVNKFLTCYENLLIKNNAIKKNGLSLFNPHKVKENPHKETAK